MLRPKPGSYLIGCALFSMCAAILALTSCSSIKLFLNGGEKQVKREPRPPAPGPYVLIFAFDGAGYDQLMAAINSGKAPAMAGMLGKDQGGDLYGRAAGAERGAGQRVVRARGHEIFRAGPGLGRRDGR